MMRMNGLILQNDRQGRETLDQMRLGTWKVVELENTQRGDMN